MRTLFAALLISSVAAPVLADHGNPWATADDEVKSRFHDTNQLKSIGTPGEDEMKGALVRSARGKLEAPNGAKGGKGKK